MKYLFCFPQGGFNDICHTIWNFYSYCKKFNRVLVIDTRNTITFKDDIRKYFIFQDDIIFKGNIDELFENLLNKKEITYYPNNLIYNSKYDIKSIKDISCHIEWRKKLYYKDISLSFDGSKDYDENVMISATVGGGPNIIKLFDIIKLNDELKELIVERYKKLPLKYLGVHVRNTDYTSNIHQFFDKNKNFFKSREVFLGTDDYRTIDFFRKNNIKMYHFSNIPSIRLKKGKGFHYNNNIIEPKELIQDCISDFFLLCLSDVFIYSSEESGYSKNIIMIKTIDKSNIKIKKLLELE